MNIGSLITYSKMMDSLIRLEIEGIENFLRQVERQNLSDSKRFEKEYTNISRSQFLSEFDYQSYIDTFDDKFCDLREINNLAEQLSILALYKLVEQKTKNVLRAFEKNPRKIYDCFRISEIKKITKKFGFNLSDVTSIDKIDELRELNNCIKHQGTVSTKLAKYKGWTEGNKIEDLSDKIKEYEDHIPKYFSDLMDKFQKNTVSKI